MKSALLASLAVSVLLAVMLAACPSPEPFVPPETPTEVWQPGRSIPTERAPNARGLLDRRGQIHAHSVYSHDACDGEPETDGVRDQDCFADFRQAICSTRQDFVMLTDHRDAFDDTEFPDTLLFREDRGDVLIERASASYGPGGSGPVANRAGCPEALVGRDLGAQPEGTPAFTTLILAGAETNEMMPVGVEGHPVERAERGSLYGNRTPENVQLLRERGALIMVAHPETKTVDELSSDEIDGFEMFNLHRLFFQQLGPALDLALRFSEGDPSLPHPDLSAVRLIEQDPLYLETWARVVGRGVQKVTTFGTDCHQNTLPGDAGDGERIDSYRRMMSWMSNHLLVEPDENGSFDDVALKEALAAGRLYGSFELYGPPGGFDFYAQAGVEGDEVIEMGGKTDLAGGPELVARVPYLQGLLPNVDPPEITARLLRAEGDLWVEVASASAAGEEIRYLPTEAGVYRFEVDIVPFHLEEWLGGDAYFVLNDKHTWVMSNPIYVR